MAQAMQLIIKFFTHCKPMRTNDVLMYKYAENILEILVERTKCKYQRTGKTTAIRKYSFPDISVQRASDNPFNANYWGFIILQ